MSVMNMLDEIGSPDKAEEYVLHLISKKQRVMGFGHRVYKTMDPRARIFKELAETIAREKQAFKWFEMALNMEKTVQH